LPFIQLNGYEEMEKLLQLNYLFSKFQIRNKLFILFVLIAHIFSAVSGQNIKPVYKDSLHKGKRKIGINFSINGGISSPQGRFGSNQYKIDADDPVYCGFAYSGYTYNATIGLVLRNGWELTVIGNYFHNGFDATGYLNENGSLIEVYQPYFAPAAIGTYSYNQSAILGGITKVIPLTGPLSLSFRFFLVSFLPASLL
jgi:hypothetical protein